MSFPPRDRENRGRPRWLVSDLAARLGISSQSLVASLRAGDAPRPVGKIYNRFTSREYLQYDPGQVLTWWRNKMLIGRDIEGGDNDQTKEPMP